MDEAERARMAALRNLSRLGPASARGWTVDRIATYLAAISPLSERQAIDLVCTGLNLGWSLDTIARFADRLDDAVAAGMLGMTVDQLRVLHAAGMRAAMVEATNGTREGLKPTVPATGVTTRLGARCLHCHNDLYPNAVHCAYCGQIIYV